MGDDGDHGTATITDGCWSLDQRLRLPDDVNDPRLLLRRADWDKLLLRQLCICHVLELLHPLSAFLLYDISKERWRQKQDYIWWLCFPFSGADQQTGLQEERGHCHFGREWSAAQEEVNVHLHNTTTTICTYLLHIIFIHDSTSTSNTVMQTGHSCHRGIVVSSNNQFVTGCCCILCSM